MKQQVLQKGGLSCTDRLEYQHSDGADDDDGNGDGDDYDDGDDEKALKYQQVKIALE